MEEPLNARNIAPPALGIGCRRSAQRRVSSHFCGEALRWPGRDWAQARRRGYAHPKKARSDNVHLVKLACLFYFPAVQRTLLPRTKCEYHLLALATADKRYATGDDTCGSDNSGAA